jgi:hypothetical protein
MAEEWIRSDIPMLVVEPSNHFGRYRLSEKFVGYNEKWLATAWRRLYRWQWLR